MDARVRFRWILCRLPALPVTVCFESEDRCSLIRAAKFVTQSGREIH
jgi:hypothetical protein